MPLPLLAMLLLSNFTMVSSSLFYTQGTKSSSFLSHISFLLLLHSFFYTLHTLLLFLFPVLFQYFSTFMLLSNFHTMHFLVALPRQIPAPGSLVFWYPCTSTLYSSQMLPLLTSSSTPSLLMLCFLKTYPMCYYTPMPLFIEIILVSSSAPAMSFVVLPHMLLLSLTLSPFYFYV